MLSSIAITSRLLVVRFLHVLWHLVFQSPLEVVNRARTRGAEQVRMVENSPGFDSARRRGVGSRNLKLATCRFKNEIEMHSNSTNFSPTVRHRITQARSQNKPTRTQRKETGSSSSNASQYADTILYQQRNVITIKKNQCTVASKEQPGKNA